LEQAELEDYITLQIILAQLVKIQFLTQPLYLVVEVLVQVTSCQEPLKELENLVDLVVAVDIVR
jgi:hypothetical protein